MIFLLRVSGVFSSVILLFSGFQITLIEVDLDLVSGQQVQEEALFDNLGIAIIGLGCFTGPLLFGIASLIEKEEIVHLRVNDRLR